MSVTTFPAALFFKEVHLVDGTEIEERIAFELVVVLLNVNVVARGTSPRFQMFTFASYLN